MENLEAGVAFVSAQQKFEESDFLKVKELLDHLPEKCFKNDEIGLERSFERFLYITDLYQEQSHLLDPKLDSMLSILLGYVKEHWLDQPPPLLIYQAFKYICHLTKIRGRKVILRHLPHELTDLEPVLKLLEQDFVVSTSSCWETRYVLLLWLTLLCKLPFPLEKFDLAAAAAAAAANGQQPLTPIKQRMLNVATPLLNVMDKSREVAALFLAEFVSRPDTVDQYLPIIVRDTVESIVRLNPNDVQEGLRTTGLCLLLADIFKRNKREKLFPLASHVLNKLIDSNATNCQNILVRKLIAKLVQRVGLVYLKPQLATWRYQRGSRSLAQNLAPSNKSDSDRENNIRIEADESESSYEIREEVERVLAFLLSALKDKDTIVRWSAAKGVGRITSRLPKSLASEVIASILGYFNRMESDGAWHGACLALAELGRRGFLLPDQLSVVVPAVVQALIYDESKGNYSVGAHVRDAACYLCWSFARCYEPLQLLPFVNQIASTLVTVAIFDREINCRRAASAAFQENVGRQGVFPHGIDILTAVDYFAVNNRLMCYKELSVFVGKFDEYTKIIIDHLIDYKLGHWDQEIRQLAALALRQLCSVDPGYFRAVVLSKLIPQCIGVDLFLRHGSILAVGEIVRGLDDFDRQPIAIDLQQSILSIPRRLIEMHTMKSVGGELMRSAFNSFVENLSASTTITIDPIDLSMWFDVLDENLCNVNKDLRAEACRASTALSGRASSLGDFCRKFADSHCRALEDATVEMQRIGAALALGSLTQQFLFQCDLTKIIDSLIRAASIRDDRDKSWAECRRDCLDSLQKIIITARFSTEKSFEKDQFIIGPEIFDKVMQITLKSFDDYTVDSRGDVGAIVRETASRSTATYLCKLAQDVTDTSVFCNADLVNSLMCKLIQQCCEKIDRTRQIACEAVTKIIDHSPAISGIQQRDLLISIFSVDQQRSVEDAESITRWNIAKEAFPKLAQLLNFPEYLYNALLGFVVTAGGIGESLAKTATESLMNHLNDIHENSLQLELFVETLLQIFKDFAKIDRVSIPLMRVFDMVLTSNYLDAYTNWNNLETLYKLTVNETGRSKIQQKINAGLAICCDLLRFENTSASRLALAHVIRTLTHPYPRSRRQASNQLYEALLAYGSLDNHSEQALSYLTETDWDADIELLKETKAEIARLLKVNM